MPVLCRVPSFLILRADDVVLTGKGANLTFTHLEVSEDRADIQVYGYQCHLWYPTACLGAVYRARGHTIPSQQHAEC